MKRRSFFGLLGLAPVAAAIMPSTLVATPARSHEQIIDGWRVNWTGWKQPTNQHILISQWIASPVCGEGMHLYASCPGGAAPFYDDQMMDTSIRGDELGFIPHAYESNEHLERCKYQGLNKLRILIDRAGPPPLFMEDARKRNLY